MPDLDLLERDTEMGLLDELLASAAASEGRFLVIEGPAGIGKSRVLAEIRRRAGSRVRVLSARGGELEGAFPFGVVRQLFEGVIADPELAERVLAGAAGPARDVLGAPTGNTQAGGASFAVLHGLYWLALNLADEQPLVLAVDDLHWVDRPSLRFLAYLLRRLEGAPILVAATLRSSEPGVDPALLAEIAQDPVVTPLRPRPLSEQAVAALIADRLSEEPEAGFAQACHTSTGGNPLLLRQLLIALAADGVHPRESESAKVREIAPRAVSRTVLLRLARLTPQAAAVARAVAVLGDQAVPSVVASLTGLEAQEVADATGALIRAEILRPDQPLGFVHPLVRDAVYQEVPPAERELPARRRRRHPPRRRGARRADRQPAAPGAAARRGVGGRRRDRSRPGRDRPRCPRRRGGLPAAGAGGAAAARSPHGRAHRTGVHGSPDERSRCRRAPAGGPRRGRGPARPCGDRARAGPHAHLHGRSRRGRHRGARGGGATRLRRPGAARRTPRLPGRGSRRPRVRRR
ncbi:AAA family ATPase [Svornostia abyssi]|uniref:AAA family ATPase n=1 Tax=Svornostia abyssi TaxID=2898438 RepID=A0ABY5PLH5_9ACTN|nr:AAA family ATPase [Parviterribacteraceae bacterium J379]